MDSFVNENDFLMLDKDRYAFAVLDRILRGQCELIKSDHQSFIMCHSELRNPVWIWTPDEISAAEKEAVWNLAAEYRPLSEGYRFNMKYEIAEYFIEKSKQIGMNVGISMNLYVYDCPSPIKPGITADGEIYRCTLDDVEEAAGVLLRFHKEIKDEAPSYARCLEKAKSYIMENALFFWKNQTGQTVACCSYKVSQSVASLSNVYTFNDERRKHYAQNLVYHVTEKVMEMGYMPMLYADADYRASNSCYEKVGYILRGKLCTISLLK